MAGKQKVAAKRKSGTRTAAVPARALKAANHRPLIQKTPGVCGGRARVRGTRIPVWVLYRYAQLGASPAWLARMYPSLSKPALAAALRYAEANRPEMESAIRANEGD